MGQQKEPADQLDYNHQQKQRTRIVEYIEVSRRKILC